VLNLGEIGSRQFVEELAVSRILVGIGQVNKCVLLRALVKS
jgi:hypothetical protein